MDRFLEEEEQRRNDFLGLNNDENITLGVEEGNGDGNEEANEEETVAANEEETVANEEETVANDEDTEAKDEDDEDEYEFTQYGYGHAAEGGDDAEVDDDEEDYYQYDEDEDETHWTILSELRYVDKFVLIKVANPIFWEKIATEAEMRNFNYKRKDDNTNDPSLPPLKKRRL